MKKIRQKIVLIVLSFCYVSTMQAVELTYILFMVAKWGLPVVIWASGKYWNARLDAKIEEVKKEVVEVKEKVKEVKNVTQNIEKKVDEGFKENKKDLNSLRNQVSDLDKKTENGLSDVRSDLQNVQNNIQEDITKKILLSQQNIEQKIENNQNETNQHFENLENNIIPSLGSELTSKLDNNYKNLLSTLHEQEEKQEKQFISFEEKNQENMNKILEEQNKIKQAIVLFYYQQQRLIGNIDKYTKDNKVYHSELNENINQAKNRLNSIENTNNDTNQKITKFIKAIGLDGENLINNNSCNQQINITNNKNLIEN